MEIRTLRYFLAAAREQNLTHAAEQLHVTQPTLSKQIKSLEHELGQQLFVRHSFSIELTDEGALLRDRAADLVRLADRIEGEFQSMGDVTGGNINFGLAESWQIRYLAREISRARQTYPNLHYHVTSGDTEQVCEGLDRGVLDFGVLVEAPDTKKYHSLAFPENDIWGVLMPENCGLSEHDRITIDDLVGLPLLCSDQSWERDIPRWAGQRMGELTRDGSFRLAYNGSLFVREGLGYLLMLAGLVSAHEGSGLAFRPLEPALENPVFLIWRRGKPSLPLLNAFWRSSSMTFKKEIRHSKHVITRLGKA